MRNTDGNKIAFIICSNDNEQLSEAVLYIDKLIVPERFTVEKVIVRGARSMTGGYNEGMSRTDARYKVYLHQDVWLINPNLIENIITLFEHHSELGIVGVVGSTKHIDSGNYLDAWDHGALSSAMSLKRNVDSKEDRDFTDAVALDGLFLATQYDITWREDLFDGWDYYDVSQCFEFIRAGYKAGIVNQDTEHPWCYHDTEAMALGRYFHYRRIMADEYTDLHKFDIESDAGKERQNFQRRELMDELDVAITKMIDKENRWDEAIDMLYENRKGIYGQSNLGYLKKIAIISKREKVEYGDYIFRDDNDTTITLKDKLRELRWAIKRMEYLKDDSLMRCILDSCWLSKVGLSMASVFYVCSWDDYMVPLSGIYIDRGDREGFMDVQGRIKGYLDELFADGSDGVL